MPDPEIHALLNEAQGRDESVQQRAWAELERFRQEMLTAARAETPEKERLLNQARERLKERLRRLLDGQDTERSLLLREHADAVIELRDRHQRCREEMIARETRINAMDGMPPALAEVAAMNNLAVRLRDLDDELAAELGRLQGNLRRKLARLAEDLEDGGTG